MGAICDVYDAVTSERSYKEAWDPAHSLKQMASWHGQFDRTLLAAFIRGIGVYPVGALVRLASGKLAVVVENAPGRPKLPVVKVFHCLKRGEPLVPRRVDLGRPGATDAIVGLESRDEWPQFDLDRLLRPAA